MKEYQVVEVLFSFCRLPTFPVQILGDLHSLLTKLLTLKRVNLRFKNPRKEILRSGNMADIKALAVHLVEQGFSFLPLEAVRTKQLNVLKCSIPCQCHVSSMIIIPSHFELPDEDSGRDRAVQRDTELMCIRVQLVGIVLAA